MQEIIVNDANVLIDLVKLDMLEVFFRLPYSFRTLDLVVTEVSDKRQRKELDKYISSQALTVHELSAAELQKTVEFAECQRPQLSFTDKAVIKYALDIGGTILTGDKNMRNDAESMGLTVRGILFVFDELIRHGIISENRAAPLLKKLYSSNPRLPRSEIEARIERWAKE